MKLAAFLTGLKKLYHGFDANAPDPTRSTEADANPALNAATQVSVDELIGLRQQARNLNLNRKQAARAQLAGGHASRFRGRGMDYQESRIYQPGDDIRNMDWRVTARTGRPHTKLYQEERERPVVVCVDLNPGMFFASRGALKSVVAARAASLIGWAAAAHGDRIGALLFNGEHHELPPRGGKHGVLRLISQLVKQSDPLENLKHPPNPEGFNIALARLRRVSRPGSLIFLLSDFYGIDDETDKHLMRLRQHNDVVAIQLLDALELSPPPPARYAVSDGLHEGILDTRSPSVRKAYADFFSQHHQTVQNLMRSLAIPLLQLSTDDDVAGVLRQGFRTTSISKPQEAAA
ncbi:hypothetical protein PA3071 [hydrothermal vent metagenome]|uniref:DUF58 domain-containing protein n=1 Tax=hydrothermal vent metagenome TaxID=652676 RepID=A0A3B1BKT3_9ZZZZ